MTAINGSQSQPTGNGAASQSMPAAERRLGIEMWGATDVGREREGNEDSIFPDSAAGAFYTPKPETLNSKGQLLIVADGVGGGTAGNEASQWAIRRAVERYYEAGAGDIGAELRQAVAHANASLTQYLQSTGTTGAGSTMTAAVIHNDKLYVANVGDSRAYLIRDGQIYQQTRDHTLTQQKVDQGLIRPEQAEMDPDSNVLTRSLGAVPSIAVDLFPPVQLQPGDLVLLCSDGLYDMLADADIARMAQNGSPRRAVDRLIAAANKQGGFDNVSVIIAQVEGKSPTAAAAGGLAGIWQGFASWQRMVIVAMLALLGLVIMAGGVWAGWRAFRGEGGGDGDTHPAATATAAVEETEAPEPTNEEATSGGGTTDATPIPTSTSTSDTSSAPAGQATSTPKPTITSTATPRPTATWTPTSTPTDTPTPEPTATWTPEPSGGGGGGGGGSDDGDNCSGSKPPCRGNQEADCENGEWVCP